MAEREDRRAAVERATGESRVRVELNLDGTGQARVATGVGFYDHMLASLAKHAMLDLVVEASGDVEVDAHHVVEDTAIVLGQALARALGDKAGIRRFGHAKVPLDEALAECVLDVAGRPYVVCAGEPEGQVYARIGGSGVPYAGSMTRHVVESLAMNAGLCVHLTLVAGRDPHHIVEAQFKALARALREAVEPDPRAGGRVRVAGVVITRQRPASASGVTFVTLEDETGHVNLVVWESLGDAQRRELLESRLMEVQGRLQREGEVVHVVAERLVDRSAWLGALEVSSRDFH